MSVREPIRNHLLASLPAEDFALLAPALAQIELPVKKMLQTKGRRIEQAYFPESGLASVVLYTDVEHRIEVGVVGREGATGLSFMLGAAKSPYDIFMQSAGRGWQLATQDLRQAMRSSQTLRETFLLFGHTQLVQMASTILANGRFNISQRLSRWLLMAQDRADGNTIFLTHDFLAVMLGVRRAGVTTTIHALEKQGLVSTKRGAIVIEDREGLIAAANGSYGMAEEEFESCFPAREPAVAPAAIVPEAALSAES